MLHIGIHIFSSIYSSIYLAPFQTKNVWLIYDNITNAFHNNFSVSVVVKDASSSWKCPMEGYSTYHISSFKYVCSLPFQQESLSESTMSRGHKFDVFEKLVIFR